MRNYLSDTAHNEVNHIVFKEGIPGFEKDKRFIIIPVEEEGPFYYLQSLDSELCLFIVDPFIFFPDYQIDLPDEQVEDLGKEEARDKLVVYVVITLHENFKCSTANLMAPIIINVITRKGIQYILQNQNKYNTKHLIFPNAENKPEERAK